jgi:hypothetical protein
METQSDCLNHSIHLRHRIPLHSGELLLNRCLASARIFHTSGLLPLDGVGSLPLSLHLHLHLVGNDLVLLALLEQGADLLSLARINSPPIAYRETSIRRRSLSELDQELVLLQHQSFLQAQH